MCTVVFIPDNGKFYIASLRDEHPNRKTASLPVLKVADHQKYIAPIDPQGGGTWVGINEGGSVIVLLNGGFVNHIKQDQYAKSRGQIVTELLSKDHPFDSWENIELTNIEPFTLILWSASVLKHVVWDGKTKYTTNIDPTKAHIWSSSTLYNVSDKLVRQEAFNEWITSPINKNRSSLLDFFKETVHPEGPIFIKKEKELKTLSYTFIEIDASVKTIINYQDLLSDTITSHSINKKSSIAIH
jgi:uncharacterized protein with NRDE domain